MACGANQPDAVDGGLMTVLVATLAGLWSDRKITSDEGQSFTPLTKIASNDLLVAGFAGDFANILSALDAVRNGEADPKKLATFDCDGLIVKDGRLWEIDASRAWLRPKKTTVLTTGTGWSEALAFLYGRGKAKDKDVRAALRYVERARTDCGQGVDHLPAV